MWESVEGNVVGLFHRWGVGGIRWYKVLDCEYTRSRYWAWAITFSLVTMFPMETSHVIGGSNEFVKQTSSNWSSI